MYVYIYVYINIVEPKKIQKVAGVYRKIHLFCGVTLYIAGKCW